MLNSDLLDAAIGKSGKSKVFLAGQCGISRQCFHLKCLGKRDFTAREMFVLCDELNIKSMAEVKRIFFA